MNNKNKVIITIIITISVGLLTILGSFALWTTTLGNNINVAFNTANIKDYIEYTAGKAVFAGDLETTSVYSGGTSTTLSIKEKNNPAYPFYAALYLEVKNISQELAQSSVLRWTVTSKANGTNDAEVIEAEGDFSGIGTGVTIVLLPSILVTTTLMDYNVYIWVDSNNANASSVVGKTVATEIWMDVHQYRDSNYAGYTTPNSPDVVDGLIPVKLSDNGATVTTVLASDPTWYDYNNKKWANAILVTNTSRSTYSGTTGVTVTGSDILAYFVWIPRYSYKVWKYTGVSKNGEQHEIEIKFVPSTTKEIAKGNGHWYTHPAFTFGSAELSGIWVGKFETSHNTLSSSTTDNNLGTDSGTICNSTGCANYTGLRVLPNVESLRYNRIANFFNASRFMESSGNPFGLVDSNVDSHMMKHSEWGAVAYLSHSKYGINEEVRINNQNTYTTGCGAATVNEAGNATCSNTYGTVTAYPQSTTGNVTGVFDMSGGAEEYVMGHYGTTTVYGTDSGFSNTYPLPDSKYYDNYDSSVFTGTTTTNFTLCTLATCGGRALNETMKWYSDGRDFADAEGPWFMLGGLYSNKSSGGIFKSDFDIGACLNSYTFRLTLTHE